MLTTNNTSNMKTYRLKVEGWKKVRLTILASRQISEQRIIPERKVIAQ